MQMHMGYSGGVTSDTGTPATGKDGEVVRTLARVAVARTLAAAERGRLPDGDVHTSLRLACEAARKRGLHVEDLVKTVKDSWHNLAEVRPLDRRDTDRALNRLITMCIVEFYNTNDDATAR